MTCRIKWCLCDRLWRGTVRHLFIHLVSCLYRIWGYPTGWCILHQPVKDSFLTSVVNAIYKPSSFQVYMPAKVPGLGCINVDTSNCLHWTRLLLYVTCNSGRMWRTRIHVLHCTHPSMRIILVAKWQMDGWRTKALITKQKSQHWNVIHEHGASNRAGYSIHPLCN